MAIDQQRRENLLCDATAYTRRALFRIPRGSLLERGGLRDQDELRREWLSPFGHFAEWELFVGMRPDDSWSIYFDEQPVLQFNSRGQLRRLYVSDRRYLAVEGNLQLLDRSVRGGQVTFDRVHLESVYHRSVLAACRWFVRVAAEVLESDGPYRIGLIPTGEESWLPWFGSRVRRTAESFEVAKAPGV